MATENSEPAAGLDLAEVERVSNLARLGLNREELEVLGRQLQSIVGAVSKMSEADLGSVDPTAQVGGLANVFREDRAVPGLSASEALANAPVTELGFLRVPAIQ